MDYPRYFKLKGIFSEEAHYKLVKCGILFCIRVVQFDDHLDCAINIIPSTAWDNSTVEEFLTDKVKTSDEKEFNKAIKIARDFIGLLVL